jgi:hypothetical protein
MKHSGEESTLMLYSMATLIIVSLFYVIDTDSTGSRGGGGGAGGGERGGESVASPGDTLKRRVSEEKIILSAPSVDKRNNVLTCSADTHVSDRHLRQNRRFSLGYTKR